jgi:hypothetical protein
MRENEASENGISTGLLCFTWRSKAACKLQLMVPIENGLERDWTWHRGNKLTNTLCAAQTNQLAIGWTERSKQQSKVVGGLHYLGFTNSGALHVARTSTSPVITSVLSEAHRRWSVDIGFLGDKHGSRGSVARASRGSETESNFQGPEIQHPQLPAQTTKTTRQRHSMNPPLTEQLDLHQIFTDRSKYTKSDATQIRSCSNEIDN